MSWKKKTASKLFLVTRLARVSVSPPVNGVIDSIYVSSSAVR